MNKDQVEGRIKEAIGALKEVTGKVVGNKSLEHKGSVENAAGQIQAGYGDLKQNISKKT